MIMRSNYKIDYDNYNYNDVDDDNGEDYGDDDDNRGTEEKRSSKRDEEQGASTVDPALVEDQPQAPSGLLIINMTMIMIMICMTMGI